MIKNFIAAALTLALAATGAAAYVAPGGKVGGAGDMIVKVVDPPPGQKKVVVKKQVPFVAKKSPVFVPKKTIVNKPVVVQKTPVLKKPVNANKPPVISKMPKGPVVISKGKPVSKMPMKFVHIKHYRRHKWYGRAIGGVVLGSLLAASVYYTYSSPPEDGLCWFWTNSDRERGYWDYCEPPEDE